VNARHPGSAPRFLDGQACGTLVIVYNIKGKPVYFLSSKTPESLEKISGGEVQNNVYGVECKKI